MTSFPIKTFLKEGVFRYNKDSFYLLLKQQSFGKVKDNKKTLYYNIPCAFDIETTSFIQNEEKYGVMYEWTFGIDDYVVYGRYWWEFIELLTILSEELNLCDNQILVCYVHNLSFEFQFIRKLLKWNKVFAVKEREPVRCLSELGIEFRCSYKLSGYSLSKVGEHLTKYKVKKMIGDLDYSLVRNSETVLSEKELKYCEHDVRVVMSYIRELIEQYGDITRIQLTKTGFVRDYCRKKCFYSDLKGIKRSDNYKKYRTFIESMKLTVDEYEQLKRAFTGGFTHANSFYSGKILSNVASYDLSSSYPTVMLSELFPMSSSERVVIKTQVELEYNLKNYCCLFDCEFYGIHTKVEFENILSYSKCRKVQNPILNNGRIYSADYLITTLTETDFKMIQQFYYVDRFVIHNFRRYRKSFLPKDLILAILKLYNDKTLLKGVEGKEVEYLASKEFINSLYGMCVTDICRDEIIYNECWEKTSVNYEQEIDKYNKSKKRFLFYPWGVWITSYARRNLYTAIYECGLDYVYSDTDSVKILNYENHLSYFKKYNENIFKKLKYMCDNYKIDISLLSPKNIKGEEKTIGIWDFEHMYDKFKTLGAKRYLVEYEGKKVLTVSGLNKQYAIKYMEEKFYDEVFENFNDELEIPSEYTGKLTHTYIDYEQEGFLTDYQGNTAHFHEMSSVNLSGADYTLKISKQYADFLKGIEDKRI